MAFTPYGTNGSIMTGNRDYTKAGTIRDYSLFAGGLDMTNASAANYDPLITGYGRLFMVRMPKFLLDGYSEELRVYKHILEFGNTGVSGINDISTETDNMTGGYAGKSVEIMTGAKDDTTSFSVKVYEFTGSPIRRVNHLWISGVSDLMSGLATYHGNPGNLPVQQSNHTAEFIYVATDRSGKEVEYACMFANCFPKSVKEDQFNYDAGNHNLVQIDVEFSCVKYESIAINYYAKQLIDRYQILANHLNFNPNLKVGNDEGYISTSMDSKYANTPMSAPTSAEDIESVKYNSNTTYNFT